MDIKAKMETHRQGERCWRTITTLAPGCGLVACIFAQVAMFSNLQTDASTVGRALAGALTATLCGALCQNLFAGRSRAKETQLSGDIILQGVMSLHPRHNPRLIEMQLLSVIDQNQRAKAA